MPSSGKRWSSRALTTSSRSSTHASKSKRSTSQSDRPQPPLVVADEPAPGGEALEPVAPHGAVGVVVEMGDPVRRLDERRSGPRRGVGDARPVARRGEADLLLERRRWRRARRPGDVRRAADGGDELVAAAVHGADHLLRCAVVADGDPGGSHPAGERRLADEAVPPDRVQQLRLRHDPVAVLDQVGQDVEDLRLDVHRRPAPPDLEARRVDHTVVELVHGADTPFAHHRFPSGSITTLPPGILIAIWSQLCRFGAMGIPGLSVSRESRHLYGAWNVQTSCSSSAASTASRTSISWPRLVSGRGRFVAGGHVRRGRRCCQGCFAWRAPRTRSNRGR